MQFSYMQRSAKYMRETVCPALSHKNNEVDRHVRLLFTATGPTYVNAAALGISVIARRVRNVYYDKGFAEVFLSGTRAAPCQCEKHVGPFALKMFGVRQRVGKLVSNTHPALVADCGRHFRFHRRELFAGHSTVNLP